MARYAPQWLQQASYAASVDRRLIGALWPTAASSGGAATVNAGTMNVTLAAGACAVPTQNNTGSTLCTWDATEQVTIGAAPGSGTNRIDIITCHPRGNDLDGGANNDFILDVIVGTVVASPTPPAVPAGQVGLYQVYVTGGAAALVQGNLTDIRPGGLNMPPPSGTGSLPRGFVASAMLATTVSVGTTLTTILTMTANLVAGRRYRVDGYVLGTQQTAASTGTYIAIAGGGANWRVWQQSIPVSSLAGSGSASTFTAAATGPATLTMSGLGPAGTFSVVSGNAFMSIEDIGST